MITPVSETKALWIKQKSIRVDTYFLNLLSFHHFNGPFSDHSDNVKTVIDTLVQDVHPDFLSHRLLIRLIATSLSSTNVQILATSL
jgi:hypothetical protein